jgi:hypothetical protein
MSTNAPTETTVRTLSQMKEAAAKGEVSHGAYDHARNFCADANTDHDWWDCTVETWKQALAQIGFLDADIQFTGFWSQGDGASFTASVDAEKIISLFVAPPAPRDQIGVDADQKEIFTPWIMHKVGGVHVREDFTALLPLAKDGELEISMHRTSRHYSHSRTVSVDLEYRSPYNTDALESLKDAAVNGGEIDYDYLTDHLRNAVESLFRDLCNAIYTDLRDEYEYLTGEEAAIECAEANEYLFTENGSIYRGVVPVEENP